MSSRLTWLARRVFWRRQLRAAMSSFTRPPSATAGARPRRNTAGPMSREPRRLLAAAAGRALRFVYISSVGVLGWPGVDGIDESFPVDVRPGEIDYHGTKAAAEQLVHAWRGGVETVVVRPTITYGPGDTDGMLTRLIRLIARGRFVRIGRGENRFHLAYIDDLVQGLILAGTHPSAPGEIFILAGHGPILVRELDCANRPSPWVRTAFPLPARVPGAADRPGSGGPLPGGRRAWAATASIQPTRDVRQARCSVRAPQLLLGQGGPVDWLHPARRLPGGPDLDPRLDETDAVTPRLALGRYARSGLLFEMSGVPEEPVAIEDYFRWYRPSTGEVVFDVGAKCGRLHPLPVPLCRAVRPGLRLRARSADLRTASQEYS